MKIQEIYDLIKQADLEGIGIVPLKIMQTRKTRAREFLKMPFGRARIVDENLVIENGTKVYVYTVHCPVDNLRKIIAHYKANGWLPEEE